MSRPQENSSQLATGGAKDTLLSQTSKQRMSPPKTIDANQKR